MSDYHSLINDNITLPRTTFSCNSNWFSITDNESVTLYNLTFENIIFCRDPSIRKIISILITPVG